MSHDSEGRRRSTPATGAILAALIMVGCFIAGALVDYLTPTTYVMTPIYTIPVLIAAWRLRPRWVVVTAIVANVVNVVSAVIQRAPLEIWLLYSSGLVIASGLAILVSIQEERIGQLLVRQREVAGQAEAARSRLEAILENAPLGIGFVDARTQELTVNPMLNQATGEPFAQVGWREQVLALLRHPDGRPVTQEELPSTRALEGQTTEPEEMLVVRPDGKQISVLERAAPVYGPGGAIVGAVVVYQDISTLKELERLRTEWTSVVAHDLRQPVTLIMGYGSLLAREIRQQPRSEQESKAIEHVLVSARNLNRMVDDLLDISRMLTGRFTVKPVPLDLPALVRMVAERMATVGVPTGPGRPLHVETIGPIPPVDADPERVEQVLSNLLSNAVKYGTPRTEIRVTVQRRDDFVEVGVTNRGPGISAEDLPHIFSRFYRTRQAETGPARGLGLGLAISRGIVEAHGGRIWVESVPGQTTTFRFTLPISTAPPA